MKISEFSVIRPITVLMATVSVLVLGFLALEKLPLTLLPEFSSSNLNVSVSYPSSSPEEVERNITRPLEEVLSTLNNLERITSTSSGTGSNIRIEYRQGTNMDLAALEVRDRLDQVRNRLPEDVEQIGIRRWQSADMPVIRFSLAWDGSRQELFQITEEILRRRLERIDGVANVDVRGLEEKQILIELDPNLLQAYGIDIFTLSQLLRSNNVNVSGGYILEGGRKYNLRTVGEFRELEEIARLPLLGGRLLLGDVARVRYDFPERESFSRLNGRQAVSVRVYKASTANVVSVCQDVLRELSDVQAMDAFRGKLAVQVYGDQSKDILKSLDDLKRAGLYGGFLAMLVLFLFLRKFRSTLIISLAIPVSIVFTFAFMYLLRVFAGSDISLNIVSLMGLMLAVGMLVDNSVVVLENIFRYKQDKGLEARQAAIRGSREVAVAILASTATTVVVFASFIFLPNALTGRYLRDFGVAVAISLIASLVVALTLVPLVASRLFSGRERPRQKFIRMLTTWYGRLMAGLLRWRFITLIVVALLGYTTFFLFASIDRELFPRVAERQIRLDVFLERSFSPVQIEDLFGRLEETLLENKEELEVVAISSGYNTRSTSRGLYRGDLTLFLKEDGKLTPTPVLQNRLQSYLPEVPGVEFRFGRMRHFGGGGDMGIEVELSGDDPALLALYAEEVKTRLFGLSGIKDVQTTLETGDDEIHIAIDRRKSEQHGLTSTDVARTVASALSTRAASRYKSEDGEIDMILQLRGANQIRLEELENIRLENRDGEFVPLYSVVNYQYRKGPLAIQRENRKAKLSVIANTEKGGSFWISQQVSQELANLGLPPGYSYSMGRQWRQARQSEEENFFGIILAIILMYIIMAALFESFIHPLTILLTVPFSLIGVATVFYLTNTSLSQMAYLGILVLFGLVVNNGIILIDHINILRGQGMDRNRAIIQGGMDRLRPILMTAVTSLFGLLPLTLPYLFPDRFGSVEGRAGMWAPVSLAVFGGLTTSTFLTLIILPAMYSYMDDLGRLLRQLAGAAVVLSENVSLAGRNRRGSHS